MLIFEEQTKAALHLEPTERLSFPEQTLYPSGLQRERQVCVSESLLVLLHPFVAQGAVSKQPEAETGQATLSGGSKDATQTDTGSFSLKLLRVVFDGVREECDRLLVLSGRSQAKPNS